MRDAFLDVLLEVSKADVDRLPKDKTGQMMTDKILPKAEAEVAKVRGARLRTDSPVELRWSVAQHKITGEEMYLIASRWPVVVPDGLVS